jgi:ABC-2 type transport system ATP-binding protein
MDNEVYLRLINVSKSIKKNKVLDSISLDLQRGKVYGFQGINGSGKTMLFRAICGLIKINEGQIVINNQLLGEEISFPPSIGALIEYPAFLDQYTGFKNLKILASINNKISDDQIRKSLMATGLDPDDKRKFKKYSLGMKQRLGISRKVIMEDPDLLIFDEPTNALDEDGIKLVRNLILELKQRNKIILIASHHSEELSILCDEIFKMQEGKVVLSKVRGILYE